VKQVAYLVVGAAFLAAAAVAVAAVLYGWVMIFVG
jgi:hypothetical protein